MHNLNKKIHNYTILLDVNNYSNISIIDNSSEDLEDYLISGDYLAIFSTYWELDELDKYIEDLETLINIHNALYIKGIRWEQLFSKIKSLNKDIIDDYFILLDINIQELIYAPTKTQFKQYENEIGSSILLINSLTINQEILSEDNLLEIYTIMINNNSIWTEEFQLVKNTLLEINYDKYSTWLDKFTIRY